MTDTTQPVVDKPDATAEPVAQGEDARNDGDQLDALLAEFDKSQSPVSPSPAQPPTTDVAALAAELQSIKGIVTEVSNIKYKTDMKATVNDVRGDLDPEIFDDQFVEAYLDAQARQNTKLLQAWLQREANPSQFKKVTSELGKQFARKFSKMVDKQATEDREAVTAAVLRGSSTRAPEEPPVKYGSLSNADFKKEVRDKYGFDPGV